MLILSTWSFGQRANSAAWPILASGGSSLDAVEAACRDAESDLSNHSVGKGGYPDRDGQVSLDASVMLSPSRRGAVAFVRNYEHPISIARAVMEKTPHVLLAGEGAEEFAAEQGFQQTNLCTDEAIAAWKKWQADPKRVRGEVRKNIEETGLGQRSHDTIGVLAIDQSGILAGACSTSGRAFKLPGRVGDSPIIGHALYVDPQAGAAVATGHGELVMGVCGTFLAVENLRRGASPQEAAAETIKRIGSAYQLTPEDQVGIIVLSPAGNWAAAALREGFQVALRNINENELITPGFVLKAD